MHYTAALEHIQKHTGITELTEVSVDELWYKINSYSIDIDNNVVGLNLFGNKLKSISFIVEFSALQVLYFRKNQISDISALKELKRLQKLSFRSNQISNISALKELTNLQILYCSDNQISDISALKDLTNLKELYLDNNQLQDISPLKDLKSLTNLDLSNNQLQDISPLKELINLKWLELSNNQIQDISPLKDLTSLAGLHLSNNQIQDISPLKELTSLTNLWLYQNQIQDISQIKTILDLPKLKILCAFGNPIKDIPIEKLGKRELDNCLESLKDYFESIKEKDWQKELNEAKLILVGAGDVGKSELVEALSQENYQFVAGRNTTKGISIKEWYFPICPTPALPKGEGVKGEEIKVLPKGEGVKGEEIEALPAGEGLGGVDFRANIWDFAGQEINQGTHQFFLTKNSLYLFVWEARKGADEHSFRYWLEVIALLSEKSPVLIVQNKTDIYGYQNLNEKDLKARYAKLVGFVGTSCKTGEGIATLRTKIQAEILKLPHIKEIWNKDRYAIREELEQSTENWISQTAYFKICEAKGLNREQALFLSEQLHHIGVILHFAKDLHLKNTVVLKPDWATEAAYELLDKKKIPNGRFTENDLEKIWAEAKFEDKQAFLLKLSEKFELIFNLSQSQEYIIPESLEINENPSLDLLKDFEKQGKLNFEYHYEFMPKGILTRFICRKYKLILGENFAKNAVTLHLDHQTFALVVSNEVEQQIRIQVIGKESEKLLYIIRLDLQEIHESLKNPKLEEMIPCYCEKCGQERKKAHFFEYGYLKMCLEEGDEELRCSNRTKINIKKLLKGILDTKHLKYKYLENLIDESDMPRFYEELDSLGIVGNEISTLKKKFIWNGGDFQYAEQLKVWLSDRFKRH